MKKIAVIDTHNNKTLSAVVQELAFKSGWGWVFDSKNTRTDCRYLAFGAAGQWGAERAITHTNSLDNCPEDFLRIDAATQMEEVIAFFEQKEESKKDPTDLFGEWYRSTDNDSADDLAEELMRLSFLAGYNARKQEENI